MVKTKDDLTGMVFGKLTVIGRAEDYIDKKGIRYARWECECSCEEHNHVILRKNQLTRKDGKGTRSCGCICIENIKKIGNENKKYNQYIFNDEYGICISSNDGLKILFSLCDYDLIKKYCWFIENGYAVAKDGNHHITMHQILCGKGADHINRNRIDNRRENLRRCSQRDNGKNRSLQKNNQSGITGVGFNKSSQQWRARITVNGVPIYLGSFNNKEDAIKARLQAEIKYFGEFAPQKHLYEQYGITEQND